MHRMIAVFAFASLTMPLGAAQRASIEDLERMLTFLMEARNRQSMEYVEKIEDLLSVNGNTTDDPQSAQQAQGVSLRELGDNPGRSSLETLPQVARHLAGIAGHKSLIWVASDNVLLDWTNSSLSVNHNSHNIRPAALRTQEAMNEAHVSVYPMDVSRLEAGGIDASIGTRNMELKPTAPTDPFSRSIAEGPEFTAGSDINLNQERDLHPGRAVAQMNQDLRPIQAEYREVAEATGGKAFRRASDLVMEMNAVESDGRAAYLLSFSPEEQADGKYHLITVKAPGRKDAQLRYRTGYLYKKEAESLRQRFAEAAWQPEDAGEIALTADPDPKSNGHALNLNIAAADLELAQHDALWTGKLDIFVIEREVSGNHARVTGQTLNLRLKPASYQRDLKEGIGFRQLLESSPTAGSMRIVVLDENSGRMGTLTVPAAQLAASN